jgi:hypothetical protein
MLFYSFVNALQICRVLNKLYETPLFCKKMHKQNICNFLSNYSKIMSILCNISTLRTDLSTVSALISCTLCNCTHIIHRQFSTIHFSIPTLLTLFQHFIHNIFVLFLDLDMRLRTTLKFFPSNTQNSLHMQSLQRYLYTIYSVDNEVLSLP